MQLCKFPAHNEGKAVVVERFNRTLKLRMWRHFTETGSNKYLHVLTQLLERYNNAKHRSIGMSPTDALNGKTPKDAAAQDPLPPKPFKYKVGDEVSLAVTKRHFEKGYTANWTEEVFTVDEVLPTSSCTYRIRALMGQLILSMKQNYSTPERPV
eukprot:scpid81843/ scgid19970/ Putative uncharacterized transposon-derived protein F54H12.3